MTPRGKANSFKWRKCGNPLDPLSHFGKPPVWSKSSSVYGLKDPANTFSKSNLYPASVLKSSFDQYVELKKLVAAQNHRMLNLDKVLMDAVSSKKAEAQPQMPRDDVLRRLRDGVSWAVSINGVIK